VHTFGIDVPQKKFSYSAALALLDLFLVFFFAKTNCGLNQHSKDCKFHTSMSQKIYVVVLTALALSSAASTKQSFGRHVVSCEPLGP
jgi:dolichyl-phosphate-mannose--protein O-mannosyl transferase